MSAESGLVDGLGSTSIEDIRARKAQEAQTGWMNCSHCGPSFGGAGILGVASSIPPAIPIAERLRAAAEQRSGNGNPGRGQGRQRKFGSKESSR